MNKKRERNFFPRLIFVFRKASTYRKPSWFNFNKWHKKRKNKTKTKQIRCACMSVCLVVLHKILLSLKYWDAWYQIGYMWVCIIIPKPWRSKIQERTSWPNAADWFDHSGSSTRTFSSKLHARFMLDDFVSLEFWCSKFWLRVEIMWHASWIQFVSVRSECRHAACAVAVQSAGSRYAKVSMAQTCAEGNDKKKIYDRINWTNTCTNHTESVQEILN